MVIDRSSLLVVSIVSRPCRRARSLNKLGAPITQNAAIEKLTEGQMSCLLLVSDHLTSKEISVLLGISRHTVDQRVRRALKTLGVQRRSQAARMVISLRPEINGLSRETETHISCDLTTFRLPYATAKHPLNNMPIALRLFWIIVIAVGSFLSMAMYMAGLKSLSRMMS